MTDFTDTIERTAASVEDLQTDLEAHVSDILGVDVTADDAWVAHEQDDDYPTQFNARFDLDGLEEELGERLGADVDAKTISVDVELTEGGD